MRGILSRINASDFTRKIYLFSLRPLCASARTCRTLLLALSEERLRENAENDFRELFTETTAVCTGLDVAVS